MMRYDNSNILKTSTGKQYFSGILYPIINPKDSDIYVITTVGDRLDLLANQYYGDSTLWWIISSVNNLRRDSIFIAPGTQLRIPIDLTSYNDEFNNINNK